MIFNEHDENYSDEAMVCHICKECFEDEELRKAKEKIKKLKP